MSYEGYVQALCSDGHFTTWDASEEAPELCPVEPCVRRIVWENGVDETNGENPETGEGYGWVELEETVESELCPTCHHEVHPSRYKIPPPGVGRHLDRSNHNED